MSQGVIAQQQQSQPAIQLPVTVDGSVTPGQIPDNLVDSDPGNIAGWVTFAVTATVVDNNQKTTYPVSLSQNGNGNPVQVNCSAR